MLQKERKKHQGSNINININLKLDNPGGKKIVGDSKEVRKNVEGSRPTAVPNGRRKKSVYNYGQDKYPTKQSIQQFVEDRTVHYQKEDENVNMFANVDRKQYAKCGKNTTRKRLKSKSLENLKVRYYARTPELESESNSKITSKSRSREKYFSRSQSNKGSKSKSKSKTRNKVGCNSNRRESPRSFLHSQKRREKMRSKSKSPLITKKRSLQSFKMKGQMSSRELAGRSREVRADKNIQTIKKTQTQQLSQPSFDKGMKSTANLKKGEVKSRMRKSSDKIKTSSPKKIKENANPLRKGVNSHKPKPRKARKPKQNKQKKYEEEMMMFHRAAIKIQSIWRGYFTRKKFSSQLAQIEQKISKIKEDKIGPYYSGSSSSNSIIPIEVESVQSQTSKTAKNVSERSNSESMNPQWMVEIQKLRRKLDEQEDMFKMLSDENKELKANLEMIHSKKSEESSRKESKELIVSNNVVSLRIQSEESEHQPEEEVKQLQLRAFQRSKRRKEKILELPPAIKTQQSRQQSDLADLKKKVQSYECSPKSQNFNVKFNQTLIKKMMSHQEQKLAQKYFTKNNQYKTMLQNSMVSPKSYHQRCSELQSKYRKEKEENMCKYKEAEKALLFIMELQEEQNSSFVEQENQDKGNRVEGNRVEGNRVEGSRVEGSRVEGNRVEKQREGVSPRQPNNTLSGSYSSPQRKNQNLVIQVDEIQDNFQKYHPIISGNSHRDIQQAKLSDDLSYEYEKAMDDKVDIKKKRDIYIEQENRQGQQNSKGDHSAGQSQAMTSTQILQFPEFQMSRGQPQPIIKSFDTSLKNLRVFYISFCEYFRDNPTFRKEIFSNMSQEMIFDCQLYLRSFRLLGEDQNENSCELIFPYFKNLASYNLAVPVYVLNAFYLEMTNEESNLFDRDIFEMKGSSKEEYQLLGYSSYELKQYYDLALVDAFNEAINFERPGGSEASNLDELTHNYQVVCRNRVVRMLSEEVPEVKREENMNYLLGTAINKIVSEWASCLGGFFNNDGQDQEKIDDSKFEDLRAQRLVLILQKSLTEEEGAMTSWQPFELFIKLQLANLMSEVLINEVTVQFMEMYYGQ